MNFITECWGTLRKTKELFMTGKYGSCAGRDITIFAILFLLIAGFVSCNKKPEQIGLDLVEQEKLPVGTDTTLSVVAYSKPIDSSRTDRTTANLAGSYFDPVFGRIVAGFYAQLRLSVNGPGFGDSPQVDSVILTLVYSGHYGNTSTLQNFSIYELTGDLYPDSVYYSNDTVATSDLLAAYEFEPRPEDSIMIDSVYYSPRLKIPLNDELGERIVNADAANLADNDAFLEFFRGICLMAEPVAAPGEGSILYFNLLNDDSRITIYYNDSLDFDLLINASCGRFNSFSHSLSSSNDPLFVQQVAEGDTALGSDNLYIQGMSGVKTIVHFPGLKEWATENEVVINQAKLIIPADSNALEYDAPEELLIYRIEDSGIETYTEDQLVGEDYLGGGLNPSTSEYEFRLSLYTQNLISGLYNDNGLSLYVSGRTVNAEAVVLAGYDPPSGKRMKIRIVYTLLNK